MVDSLDYRSVRPELSSSSPLANLSDLYTSDPISPGSPTPSSRRLIDATRSANHGQPSSAARPNALLYPTNSHPDPFSGNAKASPNAHPSFGKNQLRRKHLRDSPLVKSDAAQSAWAGAPEDDGRGNDALAQHFFDSSDDNLSSDPGPFSFAAAGRSRSSMATTLTSSGSQKGLGIQDGLGNLDGAFEGGSAVEPNAPMLGEAFQEPLSPTMNRGFRSRPFKRQQSSSLDPLSGTGGLGVLPPYGMATADASDSNPLASATGSPKAQRVARRRRLVGTSPKKLSRAEQTGRLSRNFAYDNESEAEWEQLVPAPTRMRATVDWQAEIRRLFDRGDHSLVLDNRSITSIDPAIADLSKYVHLKIPSTMATDEEMVNSPSSSQTSTMGPSTSFTSLASRLAHGSGSGSPSLSRTSSSNAAGARLADGPQLNVANNAIHRLPSALFSVVNLTMLSLRGNKIKVLPPAIGRLRNLRELNVSSCDLRYLPAEIQQLNLVHFIYFPNPFLPVPKNSSVVVRRLYGSMHSDNSQSSKVIEHSPEENEDTNGQNERPADQGAVSTGSMGPPAMSSSALRARIMGSTSFAASGALNRQGDRDDEAGNHGGGGAKVIARILDKECYGERTIPTLTESVTRLLLRPGQSAVEASTTSPAWRGSGVGDRNGMSTILERYEAGVLTRLHQPLNAKTAAKLEAARRSAAGVWDQYRPGSSRQETWCTGAQVRTEKGGFHPHLFGSSNKFSGSDVHMTEQKDVYLSEQDDDDGEASAELSTDEETSAAERFVSVDQELDQGDDATQNPWFNRCPNPRHLRAGAEPSSRMEGVEGKTLHAESTSDWPQNDERMIYGQPSISRIEWVSHVAGVKIASIVISEDNLGKLDAKRQAVALESSWIPILWRGCMPTCLDFLNDVQ